MLCTIGIVKPGGEPSSKSIFMAKIILVVVWTLDSKGMGVEIVLIG